MCKLSFPVVYPYYVEKGEKKGRNGAEVDEIICWLTGYAKKERRFFLFHLQNNYFCKFIIQ
nr:DUF2200 family protein [Proteiniphilum sp. UBA5510]